MIKAVIFDRDGVIISSENIHQEAVARAFADFSITLTSDEMDFVIGRHPTDYLDLFAETYDFDKELWKKNQKKYYYELFPTVEPFDDVVRLIKELSDNNISLGLTTSSGKEGTDILLTRLGFTKTFSAVVCQGEYERGKPEPDPYLLTAKKLGVSPSECLVFEDTALGVTAAKSAGMRCVALPNQYTKDNDFSAADLVVEDKSKLSLDFVKDLG